MDNQLYVKTLEIQKYYLFVDILHKNTGHTNYYIFVDKCTPEHWTHKHTMFTCKHWTHKHTMFTCKHWTHKHTMFTCKHWTHKNTIFSWTFYMQTLETQKYCLFVDILHANTRTQKYYLFVDILHANTGQTNILSFRGHDH